MNFNPTPSKGVELYYLYNCLCFLLRVMFSSVAQCFPYCLGVWLLFCWGVLCLCFGSVCFDRSSLIFHANAPLIRLRVQPDIFLEEIGAFKSRTGRYIWLPPISYFRKSPYKASRTGLVKRESLITILTRADTF